MTRHAGAVEPTVTEEPWGSPAGAALVAALLADLDERYLDVDVTVADSGGRPDDPPQRTAGHRPAPPAAPPDDPRWQVDPAAVARPHGTFVMARLHGEPVGCGALRPLPGGPGGVAEVKRMYTVPSARGQGVARAVLAHLVAAARELGYRTVVLETGTRQQEAMALYAADGWEPLAPYGEYREHGLSRCFALDL